MRVLALAVILSYVAACSNPSPNPKPAAKPAAVGTLIIELPPAPILGTQGEPPDESARLRDVIAREAAALQSVELARAFVNELDLAGDQRLGKDPAETIRRAVVARPVRDSRLLEVGVALDDEQLALTLCNELLRFYVSRRSQSMDERGARVRVLDGCTAARHARP